MQRSCASSEPDNRCELCRRRVLKAFNWTIVSVPYYDWYGMEHTGIKVSPGLAIVARRSMMHAKRQFLHPLNPLHLLLA